MGVTPEKFLESVKGKSDAECERWVRQMGTPRTQYVKPIASPVTVIPARPFLRQIHQSFHQIRLGLFPSNRLFSNGEMDVGAQDG